MTLTKKIRNRHVRRENPEGMVIKDRDRDVLESLYRFRVLSQKQIQLLHPFSRDTAQYRLEKLYDNRFVDRKFLTVSIGAGKSPTLYVLDRKGAEEIGVKWYYSDKDTTEGFLRHSYAINQVLVSVHLACKTHEFQFGYRTDWVSENEVKADYDRVAVKLPSGKRENLPVQPDSIFSFVAYGQRHRFFLELDRGTMESDNWKKKILAYVAYHESGAYEKRYNAKGLRVLSVIRTKHKGGVRERNLKQWTEDVGGKSRFWFTTLQQITPESLFDDLIWQVATRSEPSKLIEPSTAD